MSLLSKVRIASPCSARWSDMKGDDRVRHCGSCGLDVFNLSNMTTQEAEDFLQGTQALSRRPCLRFYRRADGTILTQDCRSPTSPPAPDPWFRVRVATLVALGLGVTATPYIFDQILRSQEARAERHPAAEDLARTIRALQARENGAQKPALHEPVQPVPHVSPDGTSVTVYEAQPLPDEDDPGWMGGAQ